jgi:hypothetical protein
MDIKWFVGLTVDKFGKVTRWVRDPKSKKLVPEKK